ncbi:MAG: hypothetical protein QGI78_06300 [Phycisphaerales bacterium]|jgi:hypothetical protein|nr:hypothetical protein [Phycisphaerales bacterium]
MQSKPTCPLQYKEAVDRYFLEHRAKVIDVAAFLDRLDRCTGDTDDFRVEALKECIEVLLREETGRTEKILQLLSDQSQDPLETAGEKGAAGAPNKGTA